MSDDEIDANARLIAAAPELLDALRRSNRILARLADEDELAPQEVESVLDNRAAIAKALGLVLLWNRAERIASWGHGLVLFGWFRTAMIP
jgi:hypothetical protein